MSAQPVVTSYNKRLVGLHWLLAALIIAAFALTYLWEAFPREARPPFVELHKVLGLAALVLLVARVVVRASTPAPPPAYAGSALLTRLGTVAHGILYILMATTIVAGVALLLARGQGVSFGLFAIPPMTAALDRSVVRAIKEVHELSANALMLLVALHVVAAGYHQLVLRDNLMKRMSFRG